jgi:hypothetical protein
MQSFRRVGARQKNTMIPSPENWESVPSDWLTSGPNAPLYSRRNSRTSCGFVRITG